MTLNKLQYAMMLATVCSAVLMGATSIVMAGECPADKIVTGANADHPTEPKGVTDEVLSAIDLTPKGPGFEGYMLRLRKLTIEPGGIVPWHTHDQRAANIMIAEGSISEYSSTCSVPIEHVAGDTVAEYGADLAHWWKNNSDKPVVIIAGDLLPPKMEMAPGEM